MNNFQPLIRRYSNSHFAFRGDTIRL